MFSILEVSVKILVPKPSSRIIYTLWSIAKFIDGFGPDYTWGR